MSFPDARRQHRPPSAESDADAHPPGAAAARSRRRPGARRLARPRRRPRRASVSPALRLASSACTPRTSRRCRCAVVGTGANPDADGASATPSGAGIRAAHRVRDRRRRAPPARRATLWRAAAEGAALGGYRFDGLQDRDAGKRARGRVIVHARRGSGAPTSIAAVTAVGDAVALVKDLVAIPAEWLGPADFAERAAAVGRRPPCHRRGARRGRPRGTRATAASSVSGRVPTGRRGSSGSTTRPPTRPAMSRSSARASRSTPAASRSSPPARWSA